MTTSSIIGLIIVGGAVATCCVVGTIAAIDEHKKNEQERTIREREAKEDIRHAEEEHKAKLNYYASMTSEDKAAVEVEEEKTEQKRLDAKKAEADARIAEANMKSTITKFKGEILSNVRKEALDYVKNDSKDLFNTWVTEYDNKIDRKIEKLSDKLDDKADDDDLKDLKKDVDRIKDRFTVKEPSSSSITPSIVVTNH